MNRPDDYPLVCIVTSGELDPSNFKSKKDEVVRVIRKAVADGVSCVQIREKALTTRLLVDLVREVVTAVGESATVVVNERPDVAIAAGAGGVHLPANSIPVRAVRDRFGKDLSIGVSTHSIAEVLAAIDAGADHVFFGPVFATVGKPRGAGLDELREVCSAAGGFPVIAIGGIDETNCTAVIEAGATGIAAIRSLKDPVSRRSLLGELGKSDG